MTCPECSSPSRPPSRYCSVHCVEMAWRREMTMSKTDAAELALRVLASDGVHTQLWFDHVALAEAVLDLTAQLAAVTKERDEARVMVGALKDLCYAHERKYVAHERNGAANDVLAETQRAIIATLTTERDTLRAEVETYRRRWGDCHALICRLGKHHGCGGTVIVADPGVGALQCEKCGAQDWNEGADYDENLLDKIEDEKWLRSQLAACRAALGEAVNRWEWFAQRCRDRTGGIDAADEYDYPRIAQLRRVAEGGE